MSFKKKSPCADKETKYCGVRFDNEIMLDEKTTSVKMIHDETEPSEGMKGDYKPEESGNKWKETNALPFEHRDLSHVEPSSQVTVNNDCLKSENGVQVVPHPWIKVDPKYNSIEKNEQKIFLSRQKIALSNQSDIIAPDSIGIYSAEKDKDETEKSLDKNAQQKEKENIFTAKGFLHKMANWVLDASFYSGVQHHGSFINQLSKALTG